MKQISLGVLVPAVLACIITGCAGDDNPWQGSADGGALKVELAADGKISAFTRADDTKSPIVPLPSEFNIKLSRTDGSFSKKWDRIENFNKEELFPIGEYTIEAEYGSRDTEGFEHPWFYASDNVSVTAGDEKRVSLTATLANAMVSLRFTDDFRNSFTAYSAALRSAGHDYIVFAQGEDRPAYMAPSQIELSLTLTNASGKQVTIQPSGFKAEACHHYVVTIGVNGGGDRNNMTLAVDFDDEVIAETVEVPLGDELFEAPAPSVVAKDFTAGETINVFESFTPEGNPRCEVYAFGGLKEVTFSLNASSTYNPPFGREIQLVNASEIDQANAVASGLDVIGLFRNPDKMGIVGLKGFLEKLPIGTHKITLTAIDKLTRVSEPIELNVIVTAVEIKIEPVARVPYCGTESEVYLSTNSPDVRDRVAFKVTNNNVDAQVLAIEDVTDSGETRLPYKYKYRLKTPELKMQSSPLLVFYGSEVDVRANTRLEVEFPKFRVDVDPFAKKVKVRIVPENPEDLKVITRDLIIISNGKRVADNRLDKNVQTGIINVFEVSPATTYNNVEYALANTANPHTAVPEFTTEAIRDVPNGNFTESYTSIPKFDIRVGGDFTDFYTRGIVSSIERNEPVGWASVNQKTCYSGATNKNSWFVVPSTFLDNGAVTIRTVGYKHSGETPKNSGSFGSTKYYCTNTPTEDYLDKCRGELFLGSYSFINGEDDYKRGIPFESRPLTLTFKYKYTPVNDKNGEAEGGEAYVKVFNSSGKEISQGVLRLDASTVFTSKIIELEIYDFGEKASKIEVGFKSTATSIKTLTIVVPKDDALDEGLSYKISRGDYSRPTNQYKAFAKGSELVIDDVVLGYDPPALISGQSNKAKLNPKRR